MARPTSDKKRSAFDGRNLEKKRKWFKEHYRENKSQILAYNRERRMANSKEKNMLQNAKQRAKKNNFEFNLELSDIIIPQFCPLLGIELSRTNTGNVLPNSPTLDRINNSKGYIKGNIWVISYQANTMKSNANRDQLIRFAREILSFYGEGI